MPLPFQPITVAAGATFTIPGPTYAFSILQAGAGATISEGGGSPQFLGMSIYTSANEHQLFGDLTIVSDSAVATNIAIARSPQQAAKLPPPTGGSPSSGSSVVTGSVSITQGGNTASVSTVGSLQVRPARTSGSAGANGTATTTPTNINGSLLGPPGVISGIVFSNTGTLNNLIVSLSGLIVIATLTPGQSVVFTSPVCPDPSAVSIFVQASTSTVTYSANAWWAN